MEYATYIVLVDGGIPNTWSMGRGIPNAVYCWGWGKPDTVFM